MSSHTSALVQSDMSATKPLVLLLGAGKNIGEAVAKKFGGGGFNVALAARSLHDAQNSTGRWSYKVDLSRPAEVAELFAKVSKEIGIPNVVIYNGMLSCPLIMLFRAAG